jgi:hypothetical protein
MALGLAMKLTAQTMDAAALSTDDRSQMLGLMQRHYENVSPAAFVSDLSEKQWVIQLRDAAGTLCGFSTQMVLDACIEDRPVKALFSGDTIVDRQHWGDRALPQAGGRLALSIAEKWPGVEVYWFLISQGFRTYRFLPVFFREFFPRFDQLTPPHIQNVMDSLARHKFGDNYHPERGIVRMPTYKLREGIAEATEERCEDPHIRFFVERNPGHCMGDELCCIARLSRDNFTDAAYRVLRAR